MVIGPLGNLSEVRAFYDTVDLLIVAGTRLRGHETADMSIKLPARRVQIDIDPEANGRTYSSDYFLCANCAPALAGLADRLQGRLQVDPDYAGDVARVKSEATENLRRSLGPYASFPEQMRRAMPRDAIWVRDITLNDSTWGKRILPLYDTRSNVYPVGAAIGPGMQLGIGAAIGSGGRKVVSMCGDGGFALNMTELWTAVQENADVAFVVMNDKGYGVIKHIQDQLYGGRRFYGDLQSPDLEKLAGLAGMPFERVEKAEDLEGAVGRAVAVSGPALVEVDMRAIGEFPAYFRPPPYATKK